jgi:hypothetical protein
MDTLAVQVADSLALMLRAGFAITYIFLDIKEKGFSTESQSIRK